MWEGGFQECSADLRLGLQSWMEEERGLGGDSQAPSLSSSSSTWSLRDSILSPRPQSSATCSGRRSSGATGSTARTQAPACVAHYKGKWYLGMLAGAQEHWQPCHSQLLTCSSLSRRPRSSATSRLRARSSSLSTSRTRAKNRASVASPAPLQRPGHPTGAPHPPATLKMPALVEDSGGPPAQARPSGPSTRGCGQLQVKLPSVLRQP